MESQTHFPDDDMPDEIDFPRGTRGKFHHPGMQINLPIYLDENVRITLSRLAQAKGVELSALVNAMLLKDVELINIGIQTNQQ